MISGSGASLWRWSARVTSTSELQAGVSRAPQAPTWEDAVTQISRPQESLQHRLPGERRGEKQVLKGTAEPGRGRAPEQEPGRCGTCRHTVVFLYSEALFFLPF